MPVKYPVKFKNSARRIKENSAKIDWSGVEPIRSYSTDKIVYHIEVFLKLKSGKVVVGKFIPRERVKARGVRSISKDDIDVWWPCNKDDLTVRDKELL